MVESIREDLQSTIASLMREIFDDARKLMRQEAQLVRVEVREDSRKIQNAAVFMAVGGAMTFLSVLLAAFMLAYVVATEWFQLSLWAGFGVVAVVMALLGVGLFIGGYKKLRAVSESSGRSMDALREGFAWMQRSM